MGRVLEIGSRLTEKDDLILVSLALKYQALYGVDSMEGFLEESAYQVREGHQPCIRQCQTSHKGSS